PQRNGRVCRTHGFRTCIVPAQTRKPVIDSSALLHDLKRLLAALEPDIRERVEEQSGLDAQLKADWQAARDAKRTASTYFDWRDEAITQAGAHWILACVFLRFLEDNGYLERPFL